MKKIVIIDYGSGNIRSAAKAFEKVAGKNHEVKVISSASDIKSATHIVLPGVGDFSDCMQGLKNLPGVIGELEKQVLENKKPFFGICVGMQLLAEYGYERGKHQGLGWIKGEVKKIEPEAADLKIPHMGWNDLQLKKLENPVVSGIKTGDHFYFVHSYHFICADKNNLVATVEYGQEITSIISSGNIFGTQFHPEKSQKNGLKIIENFINL